MPNKDDFIARRPALTLNISGFFGTGKTLQSLSFPKCYVISCDPAGLETIRQPDNAKFLANLVWYEELHNHSKEELKELFREAATSTEHGSVYGCIAHAKELAAKGEVETLIIDGFTYFVDMKWRQINEYEVAKSQTTGNVDSQAMYRNLGLYLHRFVASDLMTAATRNGLHVILTTHLKRESEEQVHGNAAIKNRAKKVMTNSDIAAQIEGGFRNKLSGLVGADLYLEKTLKDSKIVYDALCDLTRGYGGWVNAKNRFGLPPRLNLNDKTLYEAITEALKIKREGVAGVVPTAATAATTPPRSPSQPSQAKPTTTGA
jgi:hypothetical protein